MRRDQITSVKGLQPVHHLPRLGKVRGGIKKKTAGGKEYPAEVPYFVCPPEFERVYGTQPTELDIRFPVEDAEARCIPHAYKAWKASGLWCKGDGERAVRRTDQNELVEVDCPCPLLESGECSLSANLMVLVPKVSLGGVYQIDTGSRVNVGRILDAIVFTREMVGRVQMIPMKLRKRPEEMTYTDPQSGKQKKSTHYLLTLSPDLPDLDTLQSALRDRSAILGARNYALPAAVEDGPDPSPGAVVVEAEDVTDEESGDEPTRDEAPPVAPAGPARGKPPAYLRELSEAARAVGALVEGRGVAVDAETAAIVGLPKKDIYNPRELDEAVCLKLVFQFREMAKRPKQGELA